MQKSRCGRLEMKMQYEIKGKALLTGGCGQGGLDIMLILFGRRV